jgi:hypothetical protein
MQTQSRRAVLAGLAALALSRRSAMAGEQPLKIVFPFSAGGAADSIRGGFFCLTVLQNLGMSVGGLACPGRAQPAHPLPELGAGLPGLILASAGLLGWWQRRQKA